MDLKQSLKENFARYSAMVAQNRALVDARDFLKPSARMATYAQYLEKITHDKPYQKSIKSVSAGLAHFYVHGDSSLYGLLIRLGAPFASRYPLEEIQGNGGDLMESGNAASSRYTELRLSELSNNLFAGIEKDSIEVWFNNYDDTEKYPSVLPSLGYYNIVNGTTGIATGLASSSPQYNLEEVNNALIKLLWNPDISFEDIYCVPDFATGAILINEPEIRESLREGRGKGCRLRSVINYKPKERCLVVSEIPYGVYTNTIGEQLLKLIDRPDSGIDSFIDVTKAGVYPEIKIYLKKDVRPEKVIKLLYKETSLEYHFPINMTFLEDGKKPRIYGWKEALSAHLEHEKTVLRKIYEFDLKKMRARLHIVEGLLIAVARIEEIVDCIKKSSNAAEASKNLQSKFGLSEVQAKSILDIKLSRLVNLEAIKIQKEKNDLISKIDSLTTILENKTLFYQEIEKGLRRVADKFKDARRTKVQTISLDEEGEDLMEPQVIELINFKVTNYGKLINAQDIIVQAKKGKGRKLPLEAGEFVIGSLNCSSIDEVLFLTSNGKAFIIEASSLQERVEIDSEDSLAKAVVLNVGNDDSYVFVATRKGLVKRTSISEFKTNRKSGVSASKVLDGDSIAAIFTVKDGDIVYLFNNKGLGIAFSVDEVRPTGRAAAGVKGMTLDFEEGEEIFSAGVLQGDLVAVTKDGMGKVISYGDIKVQKRGGKGIKYQKNNEPLFVTTLREELTIVTTTNAIKINAEEIPTGNRAIIGNKIVTLSEDDEVIEVACE